MNCEIGSQGCGLSSGLRESRGNCEKLKIELKERDEIIATLRHELGTSEHKASSNPNPYPIQDR